MIAVEWDEAKRLANLAKHGADFRDVPFMDWDNAAIIPDLRFTIRSRAFGPLPCSASGFTLQRFVIAARRFALSVFARRITGKSNSMARKRKSASDDDIPQMTAADFARAKPASQAMPEVVAAMKRARGRPKLAQTKEHVTLRLDPKVVDSFKAQGPGWQSRINAALVRLVSRRKPVKKISARSKTKAA
jgi:uncharacterized protein (DUF4415 family)/uncharacterized DUF497 family protein